MAWTLFLARQGVRAARETAEEFAEGDGFLDHLFRIVMAVAILVVFPVLLLVELARHGLSWLSSGAIWLYGEAVASPTAAKVVAVVVGLIVAALLVCRSPRRQKIAAAPSATHGGVAVGRRAETGAAVRPLSEPDVSALRQIQSRAADATAVDATIRALDFPVRRALASHGYIKFHIETERWYLR